MSFRKQKRTKLSSDHIEDSDVECKEESSMEQGSQPNGACVEDVRLEASSSSLTKDSCAEKQNTEGEAFVELTDKRRVTIRKWRGSVLIDIREFWGEEDDGLKPGKKGISLSKDQWNKLKQLQPTIDSIIDRMK